MKKQICKNCAYYSAYYKKWSASFGELDHGHCDKLKNDTTRYDTCADFKSNERKELLRKERLLTALETTLSSVTEMAQILKEYTID